MRPEEIAKAGVTCSPCLDGTGYMLSLGEARSQRTPFLFTKWSKFRMAKGRTGTPSDRIKNEQMPTLLGNYLKAL
jgi:hypothetical protein